HGRGSAQRGHVSGPSHGSSARQCAQRSRPARPSFSRHARHAGGTRSESRRSSTPDTLPDELCRRHTALPRLCAAIATIPPMPLAGASPDASWNLEPGALVLVVIVGYAYLRRWRAVRAEAGTLALSGWRAAAFLAGLGCVLVALVSPVDRLAEQILTMHMVQHLLLLDLAPVLCLLGLTRVLLRPVTRRVQPVERRAGPLAHPVFAAVFYVATMWAWHVPALYDAAPQH